jgi:hypothetical protein
MATLPGKQGPTADLSAVTSGLTPELAALLGDPKMDQFIKDLTKAHRAYSTGGRHDPEMGAISTNMQTGERRMVLPPSKGRKDLTNEQMYQGRPKKNKRGNALTQSLAEQELTYQSTVDDPQQLRPEAQMGPGVPIPPESEVLGRDRMGEAIIRAQAVPGAGRTDSQRKLMRNIDEKRLVTPRNVPLGMEDYDLNQGRGGQMQGVDTVAGTEALEQEMASAVQEFETTGRMPANSNATVMNFIRLYGKDHPLYKRMAELAAQGRGGQ